jgi:LacI family transcriptional regulator
MPRSRPTLKDVARAAGVHASTASRALNADAAERLSPDVVARVRSEATRLGYRAHGIAAGLRTGQSRAIAVILPDITNPVFPPILRGIEEELTPAGFIPVVANTGNDGERATAVFERLAERGMDGFILASARRHDPIVDRCIEERVPLVVLNRTIDRGGISAVITDDEKGAAMAFEHLYGLGHRRIAHLGGPQSLSTGHARTKGFARAAREAGLPPESTPTVFADAFTRRAGVTAARELLAAKPRPTAIFCGNDLLALGCYDELRALGVSCPDDVSIVGYNDIPLLDLVNPPLTTIHIQHFEMGRQAARCLLQRLRENDLPPYDIVLKPELVVRSSTACPRRVGSRGKARAGHSEDTHAGPATVRP